MKFLFLLLFVSLTMVYLGQEPEFSPVKGLVISRTVDIQENGLTQYSEILFENGLLVDVKDLVVDLGDVYSFSHKKYNISEFIKNKELAKIKTALGSPDIVYKIVENKITEPLIVQDSKIKEKELNCDESKYREIRKDDYYVCEMSHDIIGDKKVYVETCTDVISDTIYRNPQELFKIPKNDWLIIGTREARAIELAQDLESLCKKEIVHLSGQEFLNAHEHFSNRVINNQSFNLYYVEK